MNKCLSVLVSVIVFTASIGSVVAGVQQENESKCARSRAAAAFRKTVNRNGGTVEVFHAKEESLLSYGGQCEERSGDSGGCAGVHRAVKGCCERLLKPLRLELLLYVCRYRKDYD